jgi:hypothetical protein
MCPTPTTWDHHWVESHAGLASSTGELPEDEHWVLMRGAIAREAAAQQAALSGARPASEAAFREAALDYRRSWEVAPPASYGRLVGMLKAAVLGGDAADAACFARAALDGVDPLSPPAAYAGAIAALVIGDDERAAADAEIMDGGSEAFGRAAAAIRALAAEDLSGLQAALAAIVADFEGREAHLTGVPIADTALMLQTLARARGLEVPLDSPLLPRSAAAPSAG